MSFRGYPGPKFTPEQLAESRASEIQCALAVVSFIALTGVALRCVSRKVSDVRYALNDYLIFVSLAVVLVQNVLICVNASAWGLGRHLPAAIENLPTFQKAALATYPLYYIASFFTKASLLALYYQLFSPNRRFRLAIYIATGIVVGQAVSCVFATIFQCIPIAGSWNHSLDAKCVQIRLLSLVAGALNLATDVLLLCLPLPVIWSLKMSYHQKLTLSGIFLLGAFVCITSVVRIVKISGIRPNDITWIVADAYIWTCVESSIGIFCACLPTLRPLFQGKKLWSGIRTRTAVTNPIDPSTSSASHSIVNKQFLKIEEHPMTNYGPKREASSGSWWTSTSLEG